jgi:hypothetical protein
MSTAEGGGDIVRDGLVFYVDAANPRSYISGSTVWNDLSRSDYRGTLINGPTFSSLNNGYFIFDGTNDFAAINSVINTGQNFSMFAWVYLGNINVRNAVFGNGYPYQSTRGWLFSTATGYAGITDSFFISIGQDERVATAANNTLDRNKWNYIGVTVTNGGTSIKLYKNGLETQYITRIQGAFTITYIFNESSIARRYSSNTEYFNGNIAQTKIYTKTLTDTEILQNFNATRSRFGI